MKQVTKYIKNSRVRTCWLRLAVLLPPKIRKCLVKQDQAGSVQCGLQLINDDEHFNQGVDFEIVKLYYQIIFYLLTLFIY